MGIRAALLPYHSCAYNYKMKTFQYLLFSQSLLIHHPTRSFRASALLNSRTPNLYQVLGLKSDAQEKDIKQAYFKLAKKYHPDLNPSGDTRDKFDKVQKAYEVLSDQPKKEAYDQQMGFGRSTFQDMHFSQSQARGRSGVYSDDEYQQYTDKRTRPQGAGSDEKWRQSEGSGRQFWEDVEREGKGKEDFARKVWDEFDDFFDFNDKHREQQTHAGVKDETKGNDYKADVEITFMDSFKGVKTQVEMNKRMICHSCKGTRAKQGSQPRKCFECGGRGTVIGNYGIRKRCKKCSGAGCIVRQACPDCEGLGVQRGTVKEDVDLPPGVTDGQKLKIKGLGHASDVFQGLPGDLLLNLKVQKHEIFKREGLNVVTELPISITEAVLGCKITIETLDGPLTIQIQPGTNSGEELKLKHHGMPPFNAPDNYDLNSLRGDHVIKFKVEMPTGMSEEEKELFREFQRMESQNRHKYYAESEQTVRERNQGEKTEQKKETPKSEEGGFFGSFKSIFK